MTAMEDCRFLEKFNLYETSSKFYLVGRDKSGTLWRVLKINRLEPTELTIDEDPTHYTDIECQELLHRIDEGNKPTGGLKFVKECYGIVGFVKFLGPYYMLLITGRREIGTICGHVVYAVCKSEIITIPSPKVWSNVAYPKDDNRYKRLLCSVDLSKDFFFSYSYNIMYSLQKNITGKSTGQALYETMFVWNEFLTQGIRKQLKNTIWTVALVHGFFKQWKLSASGKDFWLTLVSRRSRHFAGTRYLKRGVNEEGRAANDVETEQIVFADTPDEVPPHINSVVQHRGSIPLFWFQETSILKIRPDIKLKPDEEYKATRLHFENLAHRYGNPIIILNLIKSCEKKPRESLLHTEFANAIHHINDELPDEHHLKFLHLDLSSHSQSRGTNVLALLDKVASYALDLTGFLHCKITSRPEDTSRSYVDPTFLATKEVPLLLQNGVLRTNCIDCLDRTNVAQYAYGLVALGCQLHMLRLIEVPKIEPNHPLANDMMNFYEEMGDILAIQYGGSAAHNKIFCERRGQWKAATQSQELLRTIQRYYSNAYIDAKKQDAINVFLGHFQPQQGKPALWKLDSDEHYSIGRQRMVNEENGRSFIVRSLSDGYILSEDSTPVSTCNGKSTKGNSELLPEVQQLDDIKEASDSAPKMSWCLDEPSCSSSNYSTISGRRLIQEEWLDMLSSLGNSSDEVFEGSSLMNSTVDVVSVEPTSSNQGQNDEGRDETDLSSMSSQTSNVCDFSDRFAHWVISGDSLCY